MRVRNGRNQPKMEVSLFICQRNPSAADAIKIKNKAFFEYEVWQTDHSFTNKRVALIKKVLAFLDK